MYGFLLKKNFCDGWDNLLSVIITNVIFMFVGLGIIALNAVTAQNTILLVLAFILSFIIVSIVVFAYGDSAAAIADFKGIHYADFFKAIPGVLKDASLFGLMCAVITMISGFSIRYYFMQKTTISFMMGAAICWIDIFIILSLQWFVPLRSNMHNNFRKCLRKCFIIFFDNTAFSVLTGLYTIFLLLLTVLFIGFLPSVAGIEIAKANALRLRLYKYDYLEEHPELQTKRERNRIPWEELIYDDRETLGPRKLRSFLFPWKDEQR
ncbi:MAG: hypothetical protein K5786_05010 [Treponema sp.]|nr:hypothetical protein [Treponema sp.]